MPPAFSPANFFQLNIITLDNPLLPIAQYKFSYYRERGMSSPVDGSCFLPFLDIQARDKLVYAYEF